LFLCFSVDGPQIPGCCWWIWWWLAGTMLRSEVNGIPCVLVLIPYLEFSICYI